MYEDPGMFKVAGSRRLMWARDRSVSVARHRKVIYVHFSMVVVFLSG